MRNRAARANHDCATRRDIGRAGRGTPVMRRCTVRRTILVRHAATACRPHDKKGDLRGCSKARSLQGSQYAGPACAMPGKTIDGEKIDEAIR
ncbi:hypothetical protein [Burkholderia latens]|uniref:hypothetical protein n=1 Tax=Burkholderia latens TaxID=488446 RepID=UPI001AE56742|nr:hypothetical protein [Burkholderia latens]QTO46195.1 hypothetical protein J8I85_17215 [Burkholderia latens]